MAIIYNKVLKVQSNGLDDENLKTLSQEVFIFDRYNVYLNTSDKNTCCIREEDAL